MVVDDSPRWRSFIQWQLGLYPEIQIIGIAADGLEAVQRAEELQPDLILLDIQLSTIDGIEAVRRIASGTTNTAILLLSHESDPRVVRAAFRAGGRGFVHKRDIVDDLFTAIDAVAHGERFISRSIGDCDDLI
jgi:DNA-binding NarL/FixJ family response regulator